MIRRRNLIIAVVSICVVLLGVFLYSGRKNEPVAPGLEIVGSIDSVTGQVQTRIARTLDFNPVLKSQILHSQELLQADKDSTALVTLNTSTTLRLSQETKFVAEIDASRPGSLIGTVLEGHVTVLSAGKPNLFRLYSQGRELPLDQSAPPKPTVIEPQQAAPLSALVITATTADESTPAATDPSDKSASKSADKSGSGSGNGSGGNSADNREDSEISSNVLTNDDIVRQLRGQTGFFQRCYLSYIHRIGAEKELGSKKGTVTLSFRVQPNGKVVDAQLIRSDFKDDILHRCVIEVVERARFKAFGGDAVPVMEFPITLQ